MTEQYDDQQRGEAEHDRLLTIEKRVLDGLELPYRIIDVAAGDLGGGAGSGPAPTLRNAILRTRR